jgi:hypothetical protein
MMLVPPARPQWPSYTICFASSAWRACGILSLCHACCAMPSGAPSNDAQLCNQLCGDPVTMCHAGMQHVLQLVHQLALLCCRLMPNMAWMHHR